MGYFSLRGLLHGWFSGIDGYVCTEVFLLSRSWICWGTILLDNKNRHYSFPCVKRETNKSSSEGRRTDCIDARSSRRSTVTEFYSKLLKRANCTFLLPFVDSPTEHEGGKSGDVTWFDNTITKHLILP